MSNRAQTGNVRISGGDARGIKLRVPKGARPASERVRLAIFSSIASHIPDAHVLDLYCGSGAYGLEALSRGASSGVFVDEDGAALAACKANAAAIGFSRQVRVRRSSVERYVERCEDGPFDLVFIDPPYRSRPLLHHLERVLARDGLVVLETRWRHEAPPELGGLVVAADRRYGDTRVLIFSRTGAR
jgi:16S rRNA (guanine966-N2)-methyltransferase